MFGKFEGNGGKCLKQKFDLFDLKMRKEKEKEENSREEFFLAQEYEGKKANIWLEKIEGEGEQKR